LYVKPLNIVWMGNSIVYYNPVNIVYKECGQCVSLVLWTYLT